MMCFITEAQTLVEELKIFLEVKELDEIKKKLDEFYLVMILCAMNSDFDHVRDKILTGQEVPSIANLTTRLLRVPSLKSKNIQEYAEFSVMISTCGKGICGGRGCSQCTFCERMGHTQENDCSLHGFSGKTTNVSKSEGSKPNFSNEEHQEYLRLKSNNLAQLSTTPNL